MFPGPTSPREEDSVDSGEGGNIFGEFGAEAAHSESDDCLGDQAEDHGQFGSMVNEPRMAPGRLNAMFLNTVSKLVYNK